MYKYSDFDEAFVRSRAAQFRGQVERRLTGALSEDEFRPLRLMNGLYLQLHAYMLRVAIPYGTLSSAQMRQLAYIAERWDKGYGHFTTRQNIQYNWPKLTDVPDMIDALADVQMHAIQTSGNTIRNVTADQFAEEATGEPLVARRAADLLHLQQHGVGVAVHEHALHLLHVAALLALPPQLVAAAAEVAGPTGGDGFFPRLTIHMGKHENPPGRRVLDNGGHEPVGSLEVGKFSRHGRLTIGGQDR